MADKLPTVTIRKTDNPALYAVDFRFSATIVGLVRGVPGAQYIQTAKCWAIPTNSLVAALTALAGVPHKLEGIEKPQMATERTQVAVNVNADLAAQIEREYKFGTKPFDHQKTAMALAAAKRKYGLLMEMGTGKTKASIDTFLWWLLKKQIGAVLVVCPKAVVHSWAREVKQHSAYPVKVCVMLGSGKEKAAALAANPDAHVYITNYATLRDEDMENRFIAMVWKRRMAIVLDESANIANSKSQQSKAAKRIGKVSDYKLVLNGTPIANGPLDAYGQFDFLDSNILGHTNYTSFKSEYTISGGFKGKKTIGYKNLDRLQMRIQAHSYRVLKKDCLDLPEKLYRTIELDMPPKMLEAYRQLRDEAVVEMDGKTVAVPLVLTRLMRLQQITSGYLPVVDDFGNEQPPLEFEEDKLDAVQEFVNECVAQGRKVIIWSRFVREVVRTAQRLAEHGAVPYYGGVNDTDRQKAVDRFQTDPTCKVFVGQSHTGGIGITLTAATVECYMSNSFSYLDRAQSEDRAHRIGQRNNVDIVDFIMRGSVDEYLLRCLRDKKDIASVVTGDNLKEIMGNA